MAGRHDITIDQGADYLQPIAWRDENGVLINTAGYTGLIHVRLAVDVADIIYILTTANYGVMVGIENGSNIRIFISGSFSAGTNRFGRGVYDLKLTGGGKVTRVLEGIFYLNPAVSR